MHPDQDALKALMVESGFDDVAFHNLAAGVVALHLGYRF
jgi:demethylmenaquinone methyltransferase/2-methoxy-6-polyprenyl-1,4-benzoquinol methylase